MTTTTSNELRVLLVLAMLAPVTAAWAAHGGGAPGSPMVNPVTTEVGITPDAALYGAHFGFGKRWDRFRVSASIPYYVWDNSGAGDEDGLGDAYVIAEWDVVPERPQRFSSTGSFLWKLPTADEDEGLGTGETDYGAFVELAYSFERIKPFVSLGYVWRGDGPAVDYRNTWAYSLGVSRRFGADEAYVSLDVREQTLPGLDATRLLSTGWLHSLSPNHTLQLDVAAGLNDSSPDVMVVVELMTWF